MAEVTIYAEQDGGGFAVSGSDWANLLTRTEAAGTDYAEDALYDVRISTDYNECYQIVFRFNTSSTNIPSGATINSVTLETTTGEWKPGGWGGAAAGVVEAYVVSGIISDDFDKDDLVSVSEAGTLNSGGYLAATSPYDAGGNPAANIRDWEWASDADFVDLINTSGYTEIALIPANWRTSTQTSAGWAGIYTQHESTQARRPRLVVDYTEAASGVSFLPHIMCHHFIPPLIGGH